MTFPTEKILEFLKASIPKEDCCVEGSIMTFPAEKILELLKASAPKEDRCVGGSLGITAACDISTRKKPQICYRHYGFPYIELSTSLRRGETIKRIGSCTLRLFWKYMKSPPPVDLEYRLHSTEKPYNGYFFSHGREIQSVEEFKKYIPIGVRLQYIDHEIWGEEVRSSLL